MQESRHRGRCALLCAVEAEERRRVRSEIEAAGARKESDQASGVVARERIGNWGLHVAEWQAGESQSDIRVARSESPTDLRVACLRRVRQHKASHVRKVGAGSVRRVLLIAFYPIAPSVYKLALTPFEEQNGDTQRYQWQARTREHLAFIVPVEMQNLWRAEQETKQAWWSRAR